MPSNPANFTIAANSKGIINAVSNAAWYQRVSLTWGQNSAVLQGTGEGVAMKTPSGDTAINFPQSDQGYQLTALFEFSRSGPSGPFERARLQDPIVTQNGPFTITQFKSEDSTDNDFNDTYLTVVAIGFATTPVVRSVDPPAAAHTADSQLELHAKTYYNNPLVQGGDEHYFVIPTFTGQFGRLIYNGMSWSGRNASCYNEATPFGGYLHSTIQLYDCTHPGMHDRILNLSSRVSYWGSMPTGNRSANWDWTVGGSGEYTVTRVTE